MIQRLKSMHRDWPMRAKLLVGVSVLSFGATMIAAAALFAYQSYSLRDQFRSQVESLALIGANYAAAPVSFGDRAGLVTVITSLRARSEILHLVVVDPDGNVLAEIGAAPGSKTAPARFTPGFDGWLLGVSSPVRVRDETLGTLRVVATFRPVFMAAALGFLPALLAVIVVVLTGVVLATLLLSRLLLHQLQVLSSTAQSIAGTGDYTHRAPGSGVDEVGRLTGVFNSMLDRLMAADVSLRTEIAERRRLEAALVDSSRLAGMAEVATGVLHNVGNVLNSVNVSANLLRDGLSARHPNLSLLGQTNTLLRAQPDLAAFLTQDPRGRHVPPLMVELTGRLTSHHAYLLGEIDQLATNIDHIKQIVAVQQDYAKSGGVLQTFDPAELFAEALAITHASRKRHEVTLVQSYPTASPATLTTDRHQVVHILVNFLANAIKAVKSRAPEERRIRLFLTVTAENRWQFVVEDNGVGIAPENLRRIFQHGFTTRRDGHGFGLHSGALAAKRLGGQVLTHSDGPGLGARFTLDLPSVPPASPAA